MAGNPEMWVTWRNPKSAESCENGPGPFRVVRIKRDMWVPKCSCGGEGGGLQDDGHSPLCAIHGGSVPGNAVTVVMNGRHMTFHEELFRVVSEFSGGSALKR